VHRYDVGACELPIGGSSSAVAVAMRHTRQRAATCNECSFRVKGGVLASGHPLPQGTGGARLLGAVTKWSLT
jgi:hypothetical protein